MEGPFSERGAVTAEFVIVLPAAIGVFILLGAAFQVQLQQAKLFQAASVAAREVAWGSGDIVQQSGIRFEVDRTSERSCVSASSTAQSGPLTAFTTEQKQCLPNLGY